MKALDIAIGAVSVLIQLSLAVGMLWLVNLDSFVALLKQDISAISPGGGEALRSLLVQYRELLSLARTILADGGVALLCSSTLGAFVFARQWRSQARTVSQKSGSE